MSSAQGLFDISENQAVQLLNAAKQYIHKILHKMWQHLNAIGATMGTEGNPLRSLIAMSKKLQPC